MHPQMKNAANRLAAARAGNVQALGETLEGCRRYLLWVARREFDPALSPKAGASDMVQETFLEAYRDFDQFHGSTQEELLAWLRCLLLHNVANFARRYRDTAKRRLDGETSLEGLCGHGTAAELADPAPAPVQETLLHEEGELLGRAIEQLPEELRRVVKMWYEEELSLEEIGRRLGRPASTVRLRWYEAIGQLQRRLAETVAAEG
jgi:RNA polymerase sigma-70 factor (ECF subfamily)